MTQRTYLPILFAGLLAAAGVQAQSTPAAGSSDGPPKAGEASTQTMGAPNAQTTNSPVTEAPVQSKDAVRQDAQGMGAAAATSSVPPKAGEASTVTQGKPNIDPNAAPRALTRQEVVAELMQRRSTFEEHRRAMRHSGDRGMGMMGSTKTQ